MAPVEASVFFLSALSAIAVLALCTAVLALALHRRSGSPHQLRTQVRQLDIDVEELTQAVNKWTNRGRVADARARIGQVAAPAAPLTLKEQKAQLRARFNGQAPPV